MISFSLLLLLLLCCYCCALLLPCCYFCRAATAAMLLLLLPCCCCCCCCYATTAAVLLLLRCHHIVACRASHEREYCCSCACREYCCVLRALDRRRVRRKDPMVRSYDTSYVCSYLPTYGLVRRGFLRGFRKSSGGTGITIPVKKGGQERKIQESSGFLQELPT